MKTVLFALTAFAAAAIAADSSSSECAADYIVEACLGSETAKLSTCGTNDWDCQCNGHINVITCFNNCPNDPRLQQWQGQKKIYCEYASVYPSSTTTVAAAKTTTANTPAKTTGGSKEENSTTTTKQGSSGTATGTAAAATKTDNGAVDLVYNTGSMLAAVAAVVAAVL